MVNHKYSESDEFLQEMKHRIEADYREFQGYQEQSRKTLRIIHEICQRNEIRYYLAYGSLLGVIRDGGQIPWDYDIDLWVPLDQKDQLLDALSRELPETHHFITRYEDHSYRTYTLKIAPVEYDCEVLHVDVFWIVGAPETGHEKLVKRGMWYWKAMLYKYTPKKYFQIGKGKAAELSFWFRKLRHAIYPGFVLEMIYQGMLKNDCENSTWCTDNTFYFCFRRNMLGTPQVVKLDDETYVCIPEDPKGILCAYYGEGYTHYPSIEKRMEEMTYSLRRIRGIGRIEKRD